MARGYLVRKDLKEAHDLNLEKSPVPRSESANRSISTPFGLSEGAEGGWDDLPSSSSGTCGNRMIRMTIEK